MAYIKIERKGLLVTVTLDCIDQSEAEDTVYVLKSHVLDGRDIIIGTRDKPRPRITPTPGGELENDWPEI